MGFVYLVYLWKIQMFFLKVFQIRVSFTYDIEHLVLVAMAKASPLQTVAEAAVFFWVNGSLVISLSPMDSEAITFKCPFFSEPWFWEGRGSWYQNHIMEGA